MNRPRITINGRDWSYTYRDQDHRARQMSNLPMEKVEAQVWLKGWVVGVMIFGFIAALIWVLP